MSLKTATMWLTLIPINASPVSLGLNPISFAPKAVGNLQKKYIGVEQVSLPGYGGIIRVANYGIGIGSGLSSLVGQIWRIGLMVALPGERFIPS